MALAIVDGSGRLSGFHAVPDPMETMRRRNRNRVDWCHRFDLAGLRSAAFTPVAPRWVPLIICRHPGCLGRTPARAPANRRSGSRPRPITASLVLLDMTGPWTRSARSASAPAAARPSSTSSCPASRRYVMLGLMLAGVLLARRNLRARARRSPRPPSARAAILFASGMLAWVLGATHVMPTRHRIQRFFAASRRGALRRRGDVADVPRPRALRAAGMRPTASSAGRAWWPAAGRTRASAAVLAGVSAGMVMTLLLRGATTCIPPLLGWPDPMPANTDAMDAAAARGTCWPTSPMRIGGAIESGDVRDARDRRADHPGCKRRWLGHRRRHRRLHAGRAGRDVLGRLRRCSTWRWPGCDSACSRRSRVRFGLLAAIAALVVHFLLLRRAADQDLSVVARHGGLWSLGGRRLLGLWRLLPRAQRCRSPVRAGVALGLVRACAASWVDGTLAGSALALADLYAHRGAHQAERLPQPVDEEALVGEVELGGDVREEDERRRADAGLGRVEDADLPLPGLAGGCMAVTAWMNRFSSPVGIRRSRASATLSIVSSTFPVRSPESAEMCRMGAYSRNFMPLAQLVVERLREVRAAALHQVPLVGGDDDAAACLRRPRRRSPHPGRSRLPPSRSPARRRPPLRWRGARG